MLNRFRENLIGALDILFRPHKVKERIDNINRSIDEHTGFSMVSVQYLGEVRKITNNYPNDLELQSKVKELDDFESSLGLKEIIQFKKDLDETPEKTCETCSRKYLYSCSHDEQD